MPRLIDVADTRSISLAECTERLAERVFDPADEDSLHAAARDLRQLGNDRTFLGDILIDELKRRCEPDHEASSYGPQTLVLGRPGTTVFLRANIWPSPDEHILRASGTAPFYFDVPHDHNFSFLTLGYFGPGYWSDYYEYDFAEVAGYVGESVDLRFVERARLEPGKLMLYRAHLDVHVQHPADAMSVSLNVMHMAPHQGWFDQYQFDVKENRVAAILNNSANEVTLRVALAIGLENARDLAEDFGRGHPSDRMRLAAWEAQACAVTDAGERDEVWRRAEASGSLLVAGEARRHRLALAD